MTDSSTSNEIKTSEENSSSTTRERRCRKTTKKFGDFYGLEDVEEEDEIAEDDSDEDPSWVINKNYIKILIS